ncbi:MAG: methionyl-tRNA formyltransferase [Blastocatellia bacterium]
MGTPEFAVPSLHRLVLDGHQIPAVFTQPDKPAGRGKHLHAPAVKTYALDRGMSLYQPSKIRSNEEVRAIFEEISPDACIVAAYGKILPEWLLVIPRLGCINVHASLLPKYRGAAPVNRAIANGERETGVTIMQMDAGMDTGPMLATSAIVIGDSETAPELSARLARLGAELLSETLPRIESGAVRPIAQDDSQAAYAPLLKREEGLIDWRLKANNIANRVRGFQPWPGSYTDFRGGRLIVWRAKEASDAPGDVLLAGDAEPRTILSTNEAGIRIACGEGSVLLVEEVQVEGKRRVSAREFANGARLKPGDRI